MSDERIKDIYREVANEKTPAHLDNAVLAEAARSAKPRYGRLRVWTRPLAWAATVMLSVALLLEITRSPDIAPIPAEIQTLPVVDSPAPSEILQEADAVADEPASLRQEYRPPAANAGRALPATEEQKPPPISATAKQELGDVDTELEQRATAAGARARETFEVRRDQQAEGERADSAAVSLEVNDADALRPTESLTRFEGSAERSLSSIAAPACDDEEKATPETWLRCIELLEESGFHEAAGVERDALAAAFPDFLID